VADLASAGFPLKGGRLDYVAGRVVAALVFQRRDHVINLFVWPEPAASRQLPSRSDGTSREGYHVLHWTDGGMMFWAISDLNPSELREFAEEFRRRAQA
jgi:anti-sigma factor RsiW